MLDLLTELPDYSPPQTERESLKLHNKFRSDLKKTLIEQVRSQGLSVSNLFR